MVDTTQHPLALVTLVKTKDPKVLVKKLLALVKNCLKNNNKHRQQTLPLIKTIKEQTGVLHCKF